MKTWILLLAGLVAAHGAGDKLAQYRNLGKAFYENQTTHAEAVEEFRKALELAPNSARERLNYGLALIRAGKVNEGIEEIEKVQKQDPSIPHTWFTLGINYKRAGRYEEAIHQFERMIQLVPDDPLSHFHLGLLYSYTDQAEKGLKELQTAAKLDPSLAAPYYQMFNIYREAERNQDAERALANFERLKKARDADSAEDMDSSYYSEIYETIEPKAAAASRAEVKFSNRKLAGTVDAKSAGLAVLDADGDGRADLLVWSSQGIRLYRSGSEEVSNSGLAGIKDVVSVAPGDYNNDGLPDLCVLTGAGPQLYLNRKGTFEKQQVKLPAGKFNKAVWLDYDHDYDVDLFLLGAKPVLLRNQGEAGFQDHTSDFPFVRGEAIDATVFRVVADTKALDVAVSYRDRAGVLYRDRLLGRYEATPLEGLAAGSREIVPLDFDNDGSVDLAFGAPPGVEMLRNANGKFETVSTPIKKFAGFEFADLENRGWGDLIAGKEVFANEGLGKFSGGKTPPGFVDAVRWAHADFDLDGKADLAAVSADGSVHVLTNQTATKNDWLDVRLAGVKNAKLAPGAEVEVKAGTHYQKKVYGAVPLHFGLGTETTIDTVRITWPNAMIQNETKQAVGRVVDYKEAPRLSGSCPMIFTWNGEAFEFITDVLGVAPLGASSGDGKYFPVDHDEYVQIPGELMVEKHGRYEVRITEELSEVSYLDQVRLMAVDHPREVEIFSNDKWKGPPFPVFRLFGVTKRIYPIAARDGRGRDRLPAVVRKDRVYVDGFRRSYAGAAEEHSLELDFGPGAAPANRAVLVLNGWVDWADGSTFLSTAQERKGGLVPPYLQVKDAAGRWRTVIDDMGIPSGKTKTIAVDLSGKFLSASREVRIVTNLCVYWDEIFLSEETGQPQVVLTALDPQVADLHFRGFSRPVIDFERKQPEYFEYGQVMTVSNWNPTPGMYTRYGDVKPLVTVMDDRLVIMGSGDELRLSFDAAGLPVLRDGWKRDFLLFVDGWAKDRDANTAFSQTVEPLPFHGMSRYPYPATEKYPDDAEHELYQKMYNTRPALRLLRPLTEERRIAAARE